MSDNSVSSAVSCAINHIGTGIYSSGKIISYLLTKGFPDDISYAAVAELVDRGYIDDRRAARKVLTARSGKKQESRNYILNRLFQAGIKESIAEEIVSSLDDDVTTCKLLFDECFNSADEDKNEFLKLAKLRGYSMESSLKAYSLWKEDQI
ncbi:MAG: RecX family transcriptional regulator [Clostridiales bacterium]|nr:RecX family transcriptional regulator [Clostridiales bacterium]